MGEQRETRTLVRWGRRRPQLFVRRAKDADGPAERKPADVRWITSFQASRSTLAAAAWSRNFSRMLSGKKQRRFALVGPLGDRRLVVHTAGFPIDPDRLPPSPDVILLVGDGKGAMLFRYTAYGEFCGDTPHQSVDDAIRDAAHEYGDALMPWTDVPADVSDAHAFAIQYAADQLNQRDE